MISPRLLELICCPETFQPLTEAPSDLINKTNKLIAEGKVSHRSGKVVTQPLEAGLIRKDGKVLYPVRNKLPELLIGNSILIG